MRLHVLGPLRVATADDVWEPVGSLQRRLLGLLVVAGARPVAADLLMDALWGSAPDDRRVGRLQVHVHRLRRLLGDPERITHGPLGYTLEVSADEVDARSFEVRVERALAGDVVRKSIRGLEDALALWSGDAYAGITDPLIETEARRLADLRLDAIEALATKHLAAGDPDVAADLVREPLDQHPWREGFAVTRMAALARLGRQQEALHVYQSVRAALVDELGIEPGPALQEAQAAILAGEQVAVSAPAAVPIPSQLPLAPPVFTGRDAELRRLDRALGGGAAAGRARLAVVSGTAGVGKSALALTWARAHAHEFPDGVVHLDLRGWSADRPVPPDAALSRILRSFGVPTPTGDVHEQAATLRSLLRDRSVLFVLDNVASVDQARPLLPSAPGCAVLLTSRDRLPGLVSHEGAEPIALEPFDDQQAQQLLSQVLGSELGNDPDAVARLARRCAHLPLALCVAAEYVRSRPVLGLDGLLAELTDEGARLDVLDGDADGGVRSVFGRSYDRLEPGAAFAFRMLGLLPIADLDLPALAAMMGVELREARSAVAALMRAHLVDERVGRAGSPRYGTHDLLAAFAGELAEKIDGGTGQAAVDRLFDHYATGAVRAAAMLDPAVSEAEPGSDANRVELAASGGVPGPDLPDTETASTWLATELGSLVAAAAAASHAVDERLCACAGVMHAHLYGAGTGGRRLGQALQRIAIEAAKRRGDARELSERYNSISVYEADLWQLDSAREHMAAAVEVMGDGATEHVRGRSLHNQAILLIWESRYHEALAMCRRSLRHYRRGAAALDSTNTPAQSGALSGSGQAVAARAIANALNLQGSIQLDLGSFEEAEVLLAEAGDLAKALEDPIVTAVVTYNCGELALRSGRLDEALSRAEEMVAFVTSEGLGAFEGQAWNLLGVARTADGRPQVAIPMHRRALRAARVLGDQYLEAESMVRLAEAYAAAGDPHAALAAFREAISLADNPAGVAEHVRALTGLARTYVDTGIPSAARSCLEEAVRLCAPNDLDAEPIQRALADLR